MGDKVYVQCSRCGNLHRVKSNDALVSNDCLYITEIYCTNCRDGTKHLLIGEHKEDVYLNGDITLDERYY